MILIDGVKYSCLECVRGHRSSLCRHHMRPLLQVRSKGRPLLPTGNRNHRIAVFAEEIALSPKPEGLDCKKLPVVILKASDKHIMDLSNGQIVGLYEENKKTDIPKPVIRPDSFVNSSSCCNQGVSRARKLCSCNQKRVSKSRILSTYINKKMKAQLNIEKKLEQDLGLCCSSKPVNTTIKSSCCSKSEPVRSLCCSKQEIAPALCCSSEVKKEPELVPKSELELNQPYEFVLQFSPDNNLNGIDPLNPQSGERSSQLPGTQDSGNGMLTSETGKELFEVINVPSCSIPGSCCCSSDCQCPNCEVHNNAAQTVPNLEFLNNDTQFGSNLILTLSYQKGSDVGQYQLEFSSELVQNNNQDIQSIQANGLSGLFVAQGDMSMSASSNEVPVYNSMGPSSGNTSESSLNSGNHTSSNGFSPAYPTQPMEYSPALQYSQKNNDFYPHFLQQLMNSTTPESTPQPDQDDSGHCTCADDACFCTNCETHGIIEGYKLDDIFVSKMPFDLPFKANETLSDGS